MNGAFIQRGLTCRRATYPRLVEEESPTVRHLEERLSTTAP